MSAEMEEQPEQPAATACLICKHALVVKLNIFKTRTTFSKTLVSSKLSKLVQTPFRQTKDSCDNPQDICGSCASLINQVDECEIKLMALENEVKLKFKMPFPIEVHSRRADGQALEEQKPKLETESEPGPELETEPEPEPEPALVQGVAQSADGTQEFSFISIDGSGLENPTIVLDSTNVDGESVVVYREPYGDHQLTYDPTMSYLAQLEAHEADMQEEDTSEELSALSCPQRRPGFKRRKMSPGDEGLTCDICDETFASTTNMKIHKASHQNDKSFRCRFCQRDFATNIALHYHWNEEHPLKLQPCPYCDKRFINKSNLNQHINTHQDPRFTCEQCGRQFHTRGDLRKHMVFRHSNAKNFQCADCDQCFKVNWLLTRHRVRVHTQP